VRDDAVVGHEPLRAEELRSLYEDTHGDVIAICSLVGLFGYVSPACRTILGWEPEELIGRTIVDFVHPEDLAALDAASSAALRSPTACTATYRFRRRGGDYLWTESVLRRIANPRQLEATLVMVSIRDVANRKLGEARLQREADTDPLTGISNRTVLMGPPRGVAPAPGTVRHGARGHLP